jgi:iron complex outermembrane receptor protein
MSIRINVSVWLCPGALLFVLGTQISFAQLPQVKDLSEASLEQLMNVEVTSVSKKEQKISKVAAAIYVIGREDIRRSGATNIPDLLRMVPGMDVAQTRADDWAISARGFNGVFANKLLVLIDGRTVYSPVYSGVFWFMQDVPLADIERIEVIRGPGATVWGANAVNGVINIITKSSKETHGGLIEGSAGSQLAGQGLVQYGGTAGKSGDYRVFASYSGYDSLLGSNGRQAADAWHMRHAGFRSDWQLSARDSLTVQGDIFSTDGGETISGFNSFAPPFQSVYNTPVTSQGGNFLGRWKHVFSPTSDTALQVYFDRIDGTVYGVRGIVDTVDFDFQHHLALGSRHDLVWGLGFRSIRDDYSPSPATSFSPARDAETLASAFAQDEIRLAAPLWLTIGTKFEHSEDTGASLQPGIRLLWSPDDEHTVWGAVSRALRQPSRTDNDFRANILGFPGQNGIPTVISVFGNPSYQPEDVTAYELGYRWAPLQRASIDIATFFNKYNNLKSVEPGAPYLETDPLPVHVIIPEVFNNKTDANSYGAEISANLNVTSGWKLSASYSRFRMNLHPYASSTDTAPSLTNGDSPANQYQFRSYYTWSRNWDIDVSFYFVGRLVDVSIPRYARLDSRLARRLGEWAEFSIVGQNLLDDHHFEYAQTLETAVATQSRRSVYAKVAWRF